MSTCCIFPYRTKKHRLHILQVTMSMSYHMATMHTQYFPITSDLSCETQGQEKHPTTSYLQYGYFLIIFYVRKVRIDNLQLKVW